MPVVSGSMKKISASVPQKVFDRLERMAVLEGRSLSNLISYLLEKGLDDRPELADLKSSKGRGTR
jgi:metal-responsive CopG/Arc/MetJ family transcriptional regulator